MAIPIDTSKAVRSRRDQAELVLAVRNAPAGEQETNWLEWKRALDLTTKETEALIAKAVIGFANRDPSTASRFMEGSAYLLIGVEPQRLDNVTHLDLAKLEAGVAVYAGPDISWRSDSVEVESKTVLVVSVEAPRWGDPIRYVHKAFLPAHGDGQMPEGTVFIRRQASTERASASEMAMLNRRIARQPGSELELELAAAPGSALGRIDVSDETLDRFVSGRTQSLLAQAERDKGLGGPPFGFIRSIEPRSIETYRKQILGYGRELGEVLPRVLRARAVLHHVGLLQLDVINRTETTFTGVRVELTLPDYADVWTWKPTAREQSKPPDPPAAYGHQHTQHVLYGGVIRSIPSIEPLWLPRVSQGRNKVHVSFDPEDVRAEGGASLPDIWVILDQDAPEVLQVKWEATATNAKKRLRGEIEVPVGEIWSPADLLEEPKDEGEEDDEDE